MAFSFIARAAPYLYQALNHGWKASMILDHISRFSTRLKKLVSSSKESGYSDEDILNHMIDISGSTRSQVLKAGGHFTRDEKRQRALDLGKKALKTIGGLGAVAGAAVGAYKYMYPGAIRPSQILPAQQNIPGQRALPPPQKQLGGPPPKIPPRRQLPGSMPSGPTIIPEGPLFTPPPTQQKQIAQLGARVPHPSETIIPPYTGPTPKEPFTKLQIQPSTGQTPGKAISKQVVEPTKRDIIPPVISEPPQQDQLVISEPPPKDPLSELESILKGMGSTQLDSIPYQEQGIRLPKGKVPISNQPKEPEEKIKEHDFSKLDAEGFEKFKHYYDYKIKKGDEVITNDNQLATVKDIPGNTAKINIDGKDKIVKSEDIVPLPTDRKEIDDIAYHFKKAIDLTPKELKSSVVDAFGYDPKTNTALVTYHTGKSYIYPNVDKDLVEKIVQLKHLAKTKGENYIGAWYEGKESIGAGTNDLVRELQKRSGGKGKEYEKSFEEVFSSQRYAKDKLKEQYEKEKPPKKTPEIKPPTPTPKKTQPPTPFSTPFPTPKKEVVIPKEISVEPKSKPPEPQPKQKPSEIIKQGIESISNKSEPKIKSDNDKDKEIAKKTYDELSKKQDILLEQNNAIDKQIEEKKKLLKKSTNKYDKDNIKKDIDDLTKKGKVVWKQYMEIFDQKQELDEKYNISPKRTVTKWSLKELKEAEKSIMNLAAIQDSIDDENED